MPRSVSLLPGGADLGTGCPAAGDPNDKDLAEALGVITETIYGEPASAPRVGDWNRFLATSRTHKRSTAGSGSSTRGPGMRG